MKKFDRVKKLSPLGKYHQTFYALWTRIPSVLIEQLTCKQLAVVVFELSRAYQAGSGQGVRELAEHHEIKGCPWQAKIRQIEEVA